MVRIPAEYQEVEYIESTGTQYIDTGYIPVLSPILRMKIRVTDKADRDIAGFVSNVYPSFIIDAAPAQSRWYNRYGNRAAYGVNPGPVIGQIQEWEWGKEVKFNGSLVYTNTECDWSSNTQKMNIFRGRNNAFVAIYSCSLYDGDLVRNLIPCYRKSDNEPGMYDTVSGTFYTNSGTGTFLVGNDVEYSTVSLLEARRKILLNTPNLTSASGQLATFKTDISAPLKEMKVHFYPVQASGTPSPDNVLPISGWDGVTVTMPKGKNFIASDDPLNPMEHYYHTSTGRIAYSEEEDAFYTAGSGVGYTNHLTKDGYHMLFEAPTDMTATLSVYYKNVGTNYGLRFYYNNSRVGDIHGTADSTWHRYTYTRSMKKGDWITFVIYGNIYFKDIQIEYGSEATEYETYVEPTSIPITFPQTIYGGYVDLVKGEVVEEYGSDGQPITPQTYPIQAQTIKTLKGINNIFSDANGNVDVTYWTH